MSILNKIVETVRHQVQKQKKERPVDQMGIDPSEGKSLVKKIESNSDISIIGELKKASPSSETIREDFHPLHLAKSIAEGGAVGISVLTEPNYFDGELNYLEEVSNFVDIPVLRKDFIVDEYQLYQSAEMNADSVLLISEILGNDLPRFVTLARELNMEPLVEIMNENQAELAESAEANLIGINNRNLNSMEINLSRTERILNNISNSFVSVSESGIGDRNDVERVMKAGADAVLVGTAIMNSDDLQKKVRNLRSAANG